MSYPHPAEARLFVAAADELGYELNRDAVAETDATLHDCIARWGAPERVDTAIGIRLYRWRAIQMTPGSAPGDMLAAETDEGARTLRCFV